MPKSAKNKCAFLHNQAAAPYNSGDSNEFVLPIIVKAVIYSLMLTQVSLPLEFYLITFPSLQNLVSLITCLFIRMN